MANSIPEAQVPVAAAWSPLAVPAFRTVWVAVLITNIGGWMASVATAWLMTSLDPSPLMVSLVSAATSLPLFLFALPAGALADIVDRRKLLILAQFFMLALSIVLLLLTITGLITPWSLLILIFLIETGTAFETPAFLAVLPGLVPRQQLQPALALNGVGINISRIVGPALGGLVVSAIGVVSALAINAVTFAAVIFAYARLPPTQPETCLPAERFLTAIRTGLRFTRESAELKATLVRSAAFFLFASAYLALLPLIARNQLAAGASGFGILFACHGAGAVLGALLLPYVRERTTSDQLVLGGGLAAAAMTAMLAVTSHLAIAIPIVADHRRGFAGDHVDPDAVGPGGSPVMGQGPRPCRRADGLERSHHARQPDVGCSRRPRGNTRNPHHCSLRVGGCQHSDPPVAVASAGHGR